MTTALLATTIVWALAACCTAAAAQPAPAAAGERCESAVAETIKRMRGPQAHEIQFVGAKRVLVPAAKGDETDVKGEGRYRAAGGDSTSFAYSCVFNAVSGSTSGVLFRDTGSTRSGASEAAWQPDLSRFSPDDCESAAAAVLKEKYPRVGQILFDGEGRQLRPEPNELTMLEGRGAVERAAGMNKVPFRFRCLFETRSGKVVGASTSE